MPLLLAALLVAAAALWYRRHRTLDVPCSLDLEATHDHFHAHVELEGVAPEPGDAVLVHDAPSAIPLGEVRTVRSRATVEQASWLKRQWTKLRSRLDITELYEVGFE